MNREQTVEAVANVEREFNELVHGGVSDDSLVVLYRQLQNLRANARHHGLGMTRIDALDEAIHQAMSEDAKERVANRPTHPAPRPVPEHEPATWRPCDICGEGLVDPALRRGGESFVACDECRDDMDNPDWDSQEDIDATREEMEAKLNRPPPQPTEPPKSHDERRKEVTNLFGDLSL